MNLELDTSMSALHDYIRTIEIKHLDARINLYNRISEIKQSAKIWLTGLGKNAYDHSERLEGYLDSLTEQLRDNNSITPEEAFVLLCATYMHDIGYRGGDKGHAKRSYEMILKDPTKYHFGDFPPFGRHHYPRVADAVAWVCRGHDSFNTQLSKVRDDFTDQAFKNSHLNLRKLTALLRLADEVDDPYIRFNPSEKSIREGIPLVEIEANTVVWHWDRSKENDAAEFQRHIDNKIRILEDSIHYIKTIGGGYWNLVIRPQTVRTIPFMAGKPVETFVGRSVDLTKIHAIIQKRGAGAITGVKGTGGIGKTELARMYAERYKKEYPCGVFWASLKGSTWKEEAEKIIAASSPNGSSVAFPEKHEAIKAISKGVLSQKDSLLIIDNVDNAEDIITPGCFVLITTRDESILSNIPKEAIYELKPLLQDEGKELLAKILGHKRVEKDISGASRLVELLGGMPLAIDIAGQHLRDVPDLSFPDFIGKIQNKIDDLKIAGNKDKNVVSSLELSLDQLKSIPNGDELLSLFEGASICAASGFTSETLGVTAGFDSLNKTEVMYLVAKLNQRSLLEYNSDKERYSIHPLLRQIAEKRLGGNPDKEKRFKRNHCTYFLQYAQIYDTNPNALIFEKDGIWQALIQADNLDDKETRQQLIVHLSKYYWNLINTSCIIDAYIYFVKINLIEIDDLGESTTVVTLLDPLIKNLSTLDQYSRAWVLMSNGLAYAHLSDYGKAIDLYQKALNIHRRIGDIEGEGADLCNMGFAYKDIGEYRKAIDLYEKALKIHRRVGDIEGEGADLGNLGIAYSSIGEYRKAIKLYEKALEIHRRLGNVRDEGVDLSILGTALMDLGEYRKAINFHEKALEIHRRVGNVRDEGTCFDDLGVAYENLGEYEKAINFYEKALEIHRRVGDIKGEGISLGNLGSAYLLLGDPYKAINFYEYALAIHLRIGNIQGESNDYCNFGSAYLVLGNYRKAIDYYEKALKIHRKIGDLKGVGDDFCNLGVAYSEINEKTKSRNCLKDAKWVYAKLGLNHMMAKLEQIEKYIEYR